MHPTRVSPCENFVYEFVSTFSPRHSRPYPLLVTMILRKIFDLLTLSKVIYNAATVYFSFFLFYFSLSTLPMMVKPGYY